MAAKSKVTAKTAAKPAAKTTSQAKAKPKGLQLTTAQQAAYNKAYNATANSLRQKIFQKAAAQAFRKYRLGAAYATIKQYNIARGRAQAAAIAFNATRMSWRQARLAHQNAALAQRVEADMFNHATLLGRAQYAQAGEKAYVHKAVMRTVDTAQAMSHEAQLFKKIARVAGKAAQGNRKFPKGPNSAAISTAANRAGLAAASRVKTTPAVARKTAQQPIQKTAKRAGSGTALGKATQAARKGSGTSKKAPVKNAKARTAPLWPPHLLAGASEQHIDAAVWAAAMSNAHASLVAAKAGKAKAQPWLGDETTPNCIVIALANHLLQKKIVRATIKDILELTADCGKAPTIEEVLWKAWLTGWPCSNPVRLVDYWAAEKEVWDEAGLLIGFEVQTDDGMADHAALSLADKQVVSWGAVCSRSTPVEEAWHLEWRT